MRLWHYRIVKSLPNKQLKGQWNELNAIMGSIIKHGTPRHGLVDYILEYGTDEFRKYCDLVLCEIRKRNENGTLRYNPNQSIKKMDDFFSFPRWIGLYTTSELYEYHHDLSYLKICYWNLYEKYIRGLISDEEFDVIAKIYKELKVDV